MKNYQCQICGEGVLLEPREVEESGPYCMEHLFSEEFPALNQLADDAADTEKQPENPRQETTRTAPINHQQEEVAMTHSTPEPAEFGTFRAMSKLIPGGDDR